jgi:hypothetical protein
MIFFYLDLYAILTSAPLFGVIYTSPPRGTACLLISSTSDNMHHWIVI